MPANPKRKCCQRVARAHVKAMTRLIQAHHTKEIVLVQRLTTLEEAARDAVRLVDAARAEMYTPADVMLLEEIRALVK